MGMKEYEQAIELMKTYPSMMDFVGPRSERFIEVAEKALDISLPATYRRFLLEFGAGAFGASEIYGIVSEDFENSATPDGVWMTLYERRTVSMPKNMVVIYAVGDGELFCLDIEATKNEEAPVIAYQPGYTLEEQRREKIADDFGGFLLDIVKREVSLADGLNRAK